MTLKKQPIIAAFLITAIATFITIKTTGLLTERTTDDTQTIAGMNGCAIRNNYCEFLLDQQSFEVFFIDSPVVEEENRVRITSDRNFSIKGAWIEGINMYMGKSPVIIEASDNQSVEAIYFLGSCNLETMQWRMMIELGVKTHPFEVRFETTQS